MLLYSCLLQHLLGVFLIVRARGISKGIGRGELLISPEPISFLSGVNPETGVVMESGHPLRGERISGKVLAFSHGKGSTVGSYILYALKMNGLAPAAIINEEAEPIVALGAIMAGIPMVDRPEVPLGRLKSGTAVTVDGDRGEVDYAGELEGD
jgi:predicted aconitase with swiveling domain